MLKNSVIDPSVYAETSASGREYEAEYVLSIFLATAPDDQQWSTPASDTLPQLFALLDGIFSDARDLILFEPDNSGNLNLEVFRVQMLLRHLMMRGHSYAEHHADLIRAIARPHDDFLQATYGFTSEEMFSTFVAITAQIQKRIDETADFFRQAKALQEQTFASLDIDAHETGEPIPDEELHARFIAATSASSRDKLREAGKRMHHTARELFAIDLRDPNVSQAVVDACTCAPGDNAKFLSGPYAGQPTADTIIWTRPLVRLEDGIVCPSPVVLARSDLEVLEGLLLRTHSYAQRYQAHRAAALESLAIKHLKTLLPGSKVYPNIYYRTRDGRRAETDAVILLDRYVFIVEAKAGGLSLPARRGAPRRLREDIERIIEDSFKQGTRVRNHIMSTERATFENEKGATILEVQRAAIDELFIVTPTLTPLNPIGSQLRIVREKGLLSKESHWPWCIFVNDLRIISELIQSPSEFILFLRRRLAVNSLPYAPSDELDLLCKFFDDGLFHQPGELKKIHTLSLHGYTDMLDRWYIARLHGAVAQKPGRQLPPSIRALVATLESTQKPYRIAAAMRLLELDQDGLATVDAFLASARTSVLADGRERDAMLFFREPIRSGISVYVSSGAGFTASALAHAATRKYHNSAMEWLAITVNAHDGHADFEFIRDAEPSPSALQQLEVSRQRMLDAFVQEKSRLPKRNEQCPCKSGRKFKNCCTVLASR